MAEWIIDFETRSRVSLKHTNARVYASHESTEVLCMSYTCDGGVTTHIWRPGEPFPFEDEWPDYAFAADNATFEWYIWERCCVPKYGWPRLSLEQLRCIQAQAAHAGLPRALGNRGECLGLGSSAKDDQGHRNMLRLCRPQKVKGDAVRQVGRLFLGGEFDTSPEKHARNEEYCRQDVRAEALVSRLCPPLPKFEHAVWQATYRINDRGVPIDRRFVENADAIVQIEHARLADRLEAVTGIEGVTPDSLPEIKEWMKSQHLYLPSMDKQHVQEALDGEWGTIPKAVQEMLRIRQLSGDAAVKKYKAILNHADERNRCTGGHIYYKAGTGRWAAAGCQFQNLRRLDEKTLGDRILLADEVADSDNPDETHHHMHLRYNSGVIPTLGGMVRLAIKAPPGRQLVTADWSSIELRALHYLAGDAKTLKQVREQDDGVAEEFYKIAAASIFGKEPHDVTKDERQIGKVFCLGCGYAAGGNTFRLFAKGYGIELTEDRADELVKLYRRTFPLVKRLWGALRDAAVAVVKRGGRKQVGLIHFFKTGYTLNMQLPSGRAIKYYDATVVDGRFGPEIEHTYIKSGKRTAGKFNLTLPRLTENAVQGFCYDLLAESVVKADRADVPVVLLVHDEIVAEAPEKQAELKLSELVDIMEDTPRWAKGLPIKAEGGISERYTK